MHLGEKLQAGEVRLHAQVHVVVRLRDMIRKGVRRLRTAFLHVKCDDVPLHLGFVAKLSALLEVVVGVLSPAST
jgi:hypothetical protein